MQDFLKYSFYTREHSVLCPIYRKGILQEKSLRWQLSATSENISHQNCSFYSDDCKFEEGFKSGGKGTVCYWHNISNSSLHLLCFVVFFSYCVPQNPELLMCFLSLQACIDHKVLTVESHRSDVVSICYAGRNPYCNIQFKKQFY